MGGVVEEPGSALYSLHRIPHMVWGKARVSRLGTGSTNELFQ